MNKLWRKFGKPVRLLTSYRTCSSYQWKKCAILQLCEKDIIIYKARYWVQHGQRLIPLQVPILENHIHKVASNQQMLRNLSAVWSCLVNRPQNDTKHISFKSVKTSYIWWKFLTNWNFIYEEIKSRWNSENVSSHSVQNLLSSCLLSKNMKIKTCRTIILCVLLYESESF